MLLLRLYLICIPLDVRLFSQYSFTNILLLMADAAEINPGPVNPIARSVFLGGGKLSPEESRGARSKSLFHDLCYHNQMYKVYAEQD